ncbi:MAG: YhcH/YjgK/YiaL family protein, partial [Clostridia bacterium]|nr:YhcH/YjgK/YiaL family protein [Clostridia bacterium]
GRVWRGVLSAGEYGIFMPNDVHRPAMSVDGKTKPVKKILVKIKL